MSAEQESWKEKPLVYPNLIVMGAQKSGTTTLYNYLKKHPKVFMSSPFKEPGFYWGYKTFLRYWKSKEKDVRTRRQLLHQYMLKGYKEEQFLGDASTFYTLANHAWDCHIPARIFDERPDARFIYILRNPIGRIVSAYVHVRRQHETNLNINSFLQIEHSFNFLVRTSLYYEQLSNYLRWFSKDRFLILNFDEFTADHVGTMRKIETFLGLDAHDDYGELATFNKGKNRSYILSDDIVLSPKSYDAVMERLKPDFENLARFTGMDTETWDLTPETWCTHQDK